MAQWPCHKFTDDVTLIEILSNDIPSSMREITDELMKWSQENKMLINCNKMLSYRRETALLGAL